MPETVPEQVRNYLDALVPPRPPELQAMEAYASDTDFPIIGPAAGQFCYLIARIMGARQVFEMGSGYGYSTAWFARAVIESGGGRVVHTVWDEGLSRRARAHLSALGLEAAVEFRVEEAVQALRQSDGPFDLIFLDIDKQAYPEALDVIESKLRRGGVLLADNLLLSGAVLDGRDRSARTQAVRTFTRRIMEGDGWIGSIVPQRDGLMLAYRR